MVFSRTPALAIATVKLISLARMPALRASLGLLVLPARPLVPPDFHPTVLTARCGHFLDPVGRTLTHQFPSCWIYASCLLVAGQGRSSGDKPRLQASEQQGLPPQVLEVEDLCGHCDYFLLPSRFVSDPF